MSDRPFGEALNDVLRIVQRDRQKVTLRAALNDVPEYSYEAIRKMVSGERRVQPQAVEAVVRRLNDVYGIDLAPEYFLEYRVHLGLEQVRERMEDGRLTLEDLEMLLRSFERRPPGSDDQGNGSQTQ